MNVTAYKCKRCGHKWTRRDLSDRTKPAACAKCKSPYWDRARLTHAQRSVVQRRAAKRFHKARKAKTPKQSEA